MEKKTYAEVYPAPSIFCHSSRSYERHAVGLGGEPDHRKAKQLKYIFFSGL